jgi:hypothetical protein
MSNQISLILKTSDSSLAFLRNFNKQCPLFCRGFRGDFAEFPPVKKSPSIPFLEKGEGKLCLFAVATQSS